VYDELVRRELTMYLRDSVATFDVIVSADTLVYFGALQEVLAAAAARCGLKGC
jgi:predicted TPR repeat methyltransferase